MNNIIKQVTIGGLTEQFAIAKSLGQEVEFYKAHGIDIEKGGKAAVIGEIREFGGKKYQKQANGWRPVKKEKKETLSDVDTPIANMLKDAKKESEEAKLDTGKNSDIARASENHKKLVAQYNSGDKKILSQLNDVENYLGLPITKESKSQSTHIGDMSKEQKYAAAAKFGIENPEKLSTKELDKQLTDKNIEAELKKFKESKDEKKEEAVDKSASNFYKVDDETWGSIKVNNSAGWEFRGDSIQLMDAGKVRSSFTMPKETNLLNLADKMFNLAEKETTWGSKINKESILYGLREYLKK